MCGVDWSILAANLNYKVTALVNTHIAAEYVTQFILNLVQAGVSTNNIEIAGHSFGAHVAGFTGKRLIAQGHLLAKIWGELELYNRLKCHNKHICLVKGLDAAGKLFTFPITASPDKRLDYTDAAFVQVVHTAANSLGAQICLGDSDFWINGGEIQPVCLDYHVYDTLDNVLGKM